MFARARNFINYIADRERLRRLGALQEQGKIVELEFPHHPKKREWEQHSSIIHLISLIEGGLEAYRRQLCSALHFREQFSRIPVHAADPTTPCWVNGYFPGLDAISLYVHLVLSNPRYYVEIGGGNSTKFARRAIEDHKLRTEITVIEPFRKLPDRLYDHIIPQRLQDVPTSFFESLQDSDMLFFDGSHCVFQNSDATVFFIEIMPRLPSGMVFGIHDIFLPHDYPSEWTRRFYSEQYMLACYLLARNRPEEILLPNAYISEHRELVGILDPIWQGLGNTVEQYGGAFWMRKS